MERVYIHCKDIHIIKQIIDYSFVSSDFHICGISMNSIIDVTDIYEKKTTICLIEEDIDTVVQMKLLHSKIDKKNVGIIYICDKIDDDLQKILNAFVYKAIIMKNVYNILQCIYIMSQHRRKLDLHDRVITYYLNTLYMKESLRGYHYLKKAISLKMNDSQMKMGTICDRIAREYHVTSSRVNRCMRTSIASSYENNKDVYNVLYAFDHKPTCMHLISKIAEEIHHH